MTGKTKKTAFVTGSAGFVGSHMVSELEGTGYTVFSHDIKSDGSVLNVLPKLDHRFDLVVHCAYHVGGRAAIDGVPMNLAANVQLDGALFEWALRTNQKRVLYFSSSAAYPIKYQNPKMWTTAESSMAYPSGSRVFGLSTDQLFGSEPIPESVLASIPKAPGFIHLSEDMIDHSDVQQPDANYGWAKLTGERIAQSAIASGLRVHIVRPFSGHAAYQSLDYPFPSIMKRARERKNPFEVWGSKRQIRDWIHIKDVVNGSLAVVREDVDYPVNICTGNGTAMGDLAVMACAHMGYSPEIRENLEAPAGVMQRVGDPTKFFEIYQPSISLEASVDMAMRWVPASL